MTVAVTATATVATTTAPTHRVRGRTGAQGA
ncbi:hypothetical protein FHS35_002436 [Streptomyces umbrinus]|nr:hypothetical protein [Streptomyces umbrinus]